MIGIRVELAHMKYLLLSSTIFLAANTGLMAEDIKTGDPQAGLTYATETCSACHGISDEKSSVPEATPFKKVAQVPGMNAKALLVWMQTLHPTMPNIAPNNSDLMNVVSYIMILKDQPDKPTTELMAGDKMTGDPQAGLTYAMETCSACHGIADEKSPTPEATSFKEVVNVPGMNAKALLVWMSVLHPTMPNITPERKDLMNVIAYILSLKDQNQSDEQAAEPQQ